MKLLGFFFISHVAHNIDSTGMVRTENHFRNCIHSYCRNERESANWNSPQIWNFYCYCRLMVADLLLLFFWRWQLSTMSRTYTLMKNGQNDKLIKDTSSKECKTNENFESTASHCHTNIINNHTHSPQEAQS